MGFSLVAFDTEHIKRYVFGTDRLSEIRGASSLLDYLNRVEMVRIADKHEAKKVYAHGGSGLFLVPAEKADAFREKVQRAYREKTKGGAAITAVAWPAPEHITGIGDEDIGDALDLLQWQLQEEKLHPSPVLALPSHPFLRLCDSCGSEYADAEEHVDDSGKKIVVPRAPDEANQQYCASCQQKRVRDGEVKGFLKRFVTGHGAFENDPLWHEIIKRLGKMNYDLTSRPQRPKDFNIFREFKGAKNYLALVYADANNMGRAITSCLSLLSRQKMANRIDGAIYTAVCTAITRHLQVRDHLKPREQPAEDDESNVFPFDILLLGGDDVCMVVPAPVALDVALTLAETFREATGGEHTLSVSVVLAPIKYPFGLLQEMAETALKFAKKDGAEARTRARLEGKSAEDRDDSRINFLVVTGSSSSDFKEIYKTTYHHVDKNAHQEFHATLRPYAPADLQKLLTAIRGKDGLNLGRTKLHQVREAVLRMNLTTSVSASLGVLRNWRPKQRDHVVRQVYEFAGRYQMPRSNPDDPVSGFPRVIFPWFFDGRDERRRNEIYRTSLLDFIELYDFLAGTGGDNDARTEEN